ncbi:Transposase, Ptta/En/Spm, plant [Corchorus olitorius]|uniref:Transposase, Ptta/En/Spm, plant n=1 Tax=Corchorus olitorius TaxID=93759 RepID=A0A1R3JI45_9ROSI|nr:Transposase, Ptta/En/Spm, plant [Corchorus olitorius]
MNFDKSWVSVRPKTRPEYINGLNQFLVIALARSSDGQISKGYYIWRFHGEDSEIPNSTVMPSEDDMELDHEVTNLVHDVMVEREMNVDAGNMGVRASIFEQYHSHRIDRSNPFVDEDDSLFQPIGRLLGRKKNKGFNVAKRKRVSRVMLDDKTFIQAHRYVLFSSDSVAPYIQKHKDLVKQKNRSPRRKPYFLHKLNCETFTDWFRDHVAKLDARKDLNISEEVRLLARVDEPFIFASQAKKVFYIKDERDNGWVVVKHAKLRDTFDMGNREGSNVSIQRAVEMQGTEVDELNGTSIWVRGEGNIVDCILFWDYINYNEVFADLTRPRKVQGHTRMVEIWELDKEDSVVVKVNVHHLPVGDASYKLTRFLGTVVRNSDSAPISYISWSQMPVDKKEKMWKTIKEKFVFQKLGSDEFIDEEEMEHIKAWALEDMCCKWRAWKNELESKYFDEDKTPAEMDQSAKNRENRSKSDQPHCVGTKSFPKLIQTMTEEANGNHPSCADVYIRNRTRKDGNIVNEKATEVVILYFKANGPEKEGRVRCSGAKSSLSNKSGPSCSQSVQHNQEVEGLRTEVHGLKNAVSLLLGAFQRHFPDESEEIMNVVQRVVNGEAPDATSAPEISPIRNNRSSESTHQPSQHQGNYNCHIVLPYLDCSD